MKKLTVFEDLSKNSVFFRTEAEVKPEVCNYKDAINEKNVKNPLLTAQPILAEFGVAEKTEDAELQEEAGWEFLGVNVVNV